MAVVVFDNTRTADDPAIEKRYLEGFDRMLGAAIDQGGGAFIAGIESTITPL